MEKKPNESGLNRLRRLFEVKTFQQKEHDDGMRLPWSMGISSPGYDPEKEWQMFLDWAQEHPNGIDLEGVDIVASDIRHSSDD